jgi:hypothetical protein
MPVPRLAVAAAVWAAALAVPATALAVPPANDNYMASQPVSNDDQTLLMPRHWEGPPVDTSEATVQPDLLNPNPDGTPSAGGGGPEPQSCGATQYSKTVWYDLHPRNWGGVELDVSGFDSAVAVYEYDEDVNSPNANRITKLVLCQNDKSNTLESVFLDVKRKAYTIQVGGVNGASGILGFEAFYFPDVDHDKVLDENEDKECRGIPGINANGGCPPTVRGTPRYATSGTTLTMLSVQNLQKGSTVQFSCSKCGRKFTKTARRAGTVKAKSFEGRTLRAGDHLVVRITHKATGKGRFKFGAFGRSFSYAVTSSGIGKRTDRCLQPGKRKPIKCKD